MLCFTGDSSAKKEWVEVYGLLVPVAAGIAMIFAILHVVDTLLWLWLWVHSVVLDNKQPHGFLLPHTRLKKSLQDLLTSSHWEVKIHQRNMAFFGR